MASKILEHGRAVLREEGQALVALADTLGDDFVAAVSLILDMSRDGRVILSGMGKAGIIARKVSATLASIGVSSFFLHPAEAVHGDLGRYGRHDIAVMFSNVGETYELLRIVPHLKALGVPIISVTAQPSSSLGRASDVVLALGKLPEAGPLGLAPTTSTTAMLALGDALAMALLNERKVTPEQFAFFHPSGSLGQLLLPVLEVMRKDAAHCIVSMKEPVREVISKISSTPGRPGAASVVDDGGKLVGIFTDGDIRRLILGDLKLLEGPVSQVMGKTPVTVAEGALVQEALRIMSESQKDQVIVAGSDGKPLGMVDIQDVFRGVR